MPAPLLERDESLARLTALLADARRGDGRLVLVGGEAGAGKSALVRRFAAEHADGATVYAGGCEALFAPRPLGPFQDVAAATGGHLAAVVRSDARPADVLDALLAELRRRRPTIVVLEDLHWADDATLDVVRLLGRRVEGVGTLVLATYRDDELDALPALRALLGDLATSPAVRRVEVRPLSVDAVRELAAPHALDAAELHRRTGGNAFFVTEALDSRADLPVTVRDAVLARAGRLPAGARALVDAVAVVPGGVPLDLLDTLVPDHGAALEAALAGGTLVEAGAGVGFRHELARLAVESAIPAPRRVDLHRRALAAFADRGDEGDLARLAHHADAAGDAEAVLAYAPRAAARAASLSAHPEAAALYARALRHGDALEPAARADLLAAFSYEAYVSDRVDDAFAARLQEVELRRALGDRLAEGDGLRWLSRLSWFNIRNDDAVAYGEQAVALLETLPESRELAMALSNVAQLSMLAFDDDEAVRRGERALELADRLGDLETRIHALNNIGSAVLHDDAVDVGNAALLESLRLALDAGLEEHAARAWTNLATNAVMRRDYDHADTWLAEGIAYARERDIPSWSLYMLGWVARADLERDRWADATAASQEVLRDPRSAAPLRMSALVVRALVRLRLGDPDVDGPLAEAAALARATGELQRLAPVAAAEAERAWLAGDDAAVDLATADVLARATAARAGWLVGELEAWRRRAGLAPTPGLVVRGPWALELDGRPADAAAAWEQLGCRHDAALALAAAADDDGPARDAVVRLEAIGARGTAAAVARRLRARGVRGLPRRSVEARPAGLTARELEVLALLADGLRNTEIAQRLVLSPKTVEHHVTAILRKLGAPTRSAAAALAVARGMVPVAREDGGFPR